MSLGVCWQAGLWTFKCRNTSSVVCSSLGVQLELRPQPLVIRCVSSETKGAPRKDTMCACGLWQHNLRGGPMADEQSGGARQTHSGTLSDGGGFADRRRGVLRLYGSGCCPVGSALGWRSRANLAGDGWRRSRRCWDLPWPCAAFGISDGLDAARPRPWLRPSGWWWSVFTAT